MTMPDTAGNALRPQDVFMTLTGFKKTALLRTALELSLFDAIADGASVAEDVAARLGTDPRATRFLLDALSATGSLTADGGGYRLVPGTAQLLTGGGSRYIGGLARIAASYSEWEVYGRLTETVRTGAPLAEVDAQAADFGYWTDFAQHPTPATAKGAAMVADILAPWLGERGTVDVLDAGCGSGAFGLELAARHPQARVTLQDWPTVLQAAERQAKARDLSDRVVLSPGDIFKDGLTGGPYDVVIAGNLLFLFDPGRAAALVRRLARVLRPGGRLVVASFMTGPDGPDPEHAHLLNLLMLSWTRGGELLPPQAYEDMATAAGLTQTRVHRHEGVPLQAVVAVRPLREEPSS